MASGSRKVKEREPAREMISKGPRYLSASFFRRAGSAEELRFDEYLLANLEIRRWHAVAIRGPLGARLRFQDI